MAYYDTGNRSRGRFSEQTNPVKSMELPDREFHPERYPGSMGMRQQGWNPYRDEEEMPEEKVSSWDGQRMRNNETFSMENGLPGLDPSETNSMRQWRQPEPAEAWQRTEPASAWTQPERTEQWPEMNSMQQQRQPEPAEAWQNTEPAPVQMQPDRSESWQVSAPAPACWRGNGSRGGAPYYRYGYLDVLEEEQKMEKELRRLQSMYPQAAREILPLVEYACDKMEYEGSMMFDERPDQGAVYRICDEICAQLGELYPQEAEDQTVMLQSMEYQRNRRRPPHGNFLSDLVQVMLIQEMHRRRCRHHRCRPRRY